MKVVKAPAGRGPALLYRLTILMLFGIMYIPIAKQQARVKIAPSAEALGERCAFETLKAQCRVPVSRPLELVMKVQASEA